MTNRDTGWLVVGICLFLIVLSLAGCSEPRTQIVTETRTQVCPAGEPPIECPAWPAWDGGSLRDLLIHLAKAERSHDRCATRARQYDEAIDRCRKSVDERERDRHEQQQ